MICSLQLNTSSIPATISVNNKSTQTEILIDSCASRNFIHKSLVDHENFETKPLNRTINVFNVDGTTNRQKQITHAVKAEIDIDN